MKALLRKAVCHFLEWLTDGRIQISSGGVRVDELRLYSDRDIRVHSSGHTILSSSNKPEMREGYRYSIWLNPSLDDAGQPIMLIPVVHEDGREWDAPLNIVDGTVILPPGWKVL